MQGLFRTEKSDVVFYDQISLGPILSDTSIKSNCETPTRYLYLRS